MARTLGIVSTTYHLLVFLFVKEVFLQEDDVDLIVTDKTAYMEEIYKTGRLESYFRNVSFADGRKISNPYKSATVTLWESFVYNSTTPKILDKKLGIYDRVFFAAPGTPDEIVKEIGKTLIKKNRKVTFHRFEDGFASYTKKPVHLINTPHGINMYKKFFKYNIAETEKELYLFEPNLAEAHVDFEKVQIPKNPALIDKIISYAKDIFQFESKSFTEPYLFLGQGTLNSSGNPQTYQRLVLEFAGLAGRDRFLIKPHPRGPYDDFHGALKLYDDNCPFELAIADGGLEDKTLLSFYSTACVSGSLLFNSKSKVIFLYPLAEDSFNEKCDYEDYFRKLTEMYDTIHIAWTKEDLVKLLAD